MMNEDRADMWKKVPTKEEWVEWGMANRREVETSEESIDEAVARWLGVEITYDRENGWWETSDPRYAEPNDPHVWSPSTDWAQGGPIIEREGISLFRHTAPPVLNCGEYYWKANKTYGTTPLIAAMRCYIETKEGEQ
jgi:hypothetical protein